MFRYLVAHMSKLREPRFSWQHAPWAALAASLAVMLSALFSAVPLRDAGTLEPFAAARFVLSDSYVLLAPLSNVLDTLSLLTVPQHIAVVIAVMVVYAKWRWWRWWRSSPREISVRGEEEKRRHGAGGVGVCMCGGGDSPAPHGGLLAVGEEYASDIIVVDFHSHTSYSHDGRPGFSPEANRAWHQRGGFDAAYITDHRTFPGGGRRGSSCATPRRRGRRRCCSRGLRWGGMARM